MRRTFLTKK